MIKDFNYKGITVRIKTNVLKDGKLYFGEKNISEEIVKAYSDVTYGKDDITKENILIDIYRNLATKGIKAHEIKCEDLSNEGTHMINQNNLEE